MNPIIMLNSKFPSRNRVRGNFIERRWVRSFEPVVHELRERRILMDNSPFTGSPRRVPNYTEEE